MTKPQTLEEYTKAVGKRFRRTRDQMERDLSRDQSFAEWLEQPEEPAKQEGPKVRFRRTKSEIRRGLTVEQAMTERPKSARQIDPIIERRGEVCYVKTCEKCNGFMLKEEMIDEVSTTIIINCMCPCHKERFE